VTWRRIFVHDAVACVLLAGCIAALIWRARGLERLVNGLTALAFVLVLGIFAWRSSSAMMLGADYRHAQSAIVPWLFFSGIVWCMGWTYGATVMANLKVQQALTTAALHDPLTGLPNRRAFDARARESVAAARRHGGCFGVAIFDLDGFKQVNDHYGHAMGDQLLAAFARRLSRLSRADETAFRLGGDEFVLLLTGMREGDDIRKAIARFDGELSGGIEVDGVRLDIAPSIGGAAFPGDGQSIDALMAVADRRMYDAKATRRSYGAATSGRAVA
jgi:diguanylate cyclase (GGDEF)-like protein